MDYYDYNDRWKFITNFNINKYDIYIKSANEYNKKVGEKIITISKKSKGGFSDMGSVWCYRNRELSEFWYIYDKNINDIVNKVEELGFEIVEKKLPSCCRTE
jgi:hypothetical protein